MILKNYLPEIFFDTADRVYLKLIRKTRVAYTKGEIFRLRHIPFAFFPFLTRPRSKQSPN